MSYESSDTFFDFLISSISKHSLNDSGLILDVGCGAGANTQRISKIFTNSKIIGIDNETELINYARLQNTSNSNVNFEVADIFQIKYNSINGIVAIQTISWIPSNSMYDPIEALLKLNPKWICFSSLGFNGNAEAEVKINNFSESGFWSSPYNILSNPKIIELAKSYNYDLVNLISYVPKLPIFNANSGMGSYTKKMADGGLSIFSGPLYLPWFFYFLEQN
jgi:SAM-dependent methyltransferase